MGRLSLLLLAALLAAIVSSASAGGERNAYRSEAEAWRKARALAAGFAQFLADERAGRVPPRKARAPVEPEIQHEATLGVLETLAYRGYPGERHSVRTQDGYTLTLFRVPHGRAGPGVGKRPVAYLQHGLLDQAFTWINNLPHQSLAFLLADAGFDVWLGNMRGNTHSRTHATHDPDWDTAFWRYSYDHIARLDLRAAFEYVCAHTGQPQLFYVGHSLGTMVGFAAFPRYPEIAARVRVFVALAPVAKLQTIQGPLAELAPLAETLGEVLHMFGVGEFMGVGFDLLRYLSRLYCLQVSTPEVCDNSLFLAMGFNESNLNLTRLPVYKSQVPAGSSVQNLLHMAQGVNRGTFRMYDLGAPNLNLDEYGSTTPPDYEPRRMRVPTALYYANSDWLAGRQDVEWLVSELAQATLPRDTRAPADDKALKAKPALLYAKHVEGYAHADFIWAHNAARLIYNEIVQLFRSYL